MPTSPHNRPSDYRPYGVKPKKSGSKYKSFSLYTAKKPPKPKKKKRGLHIEITKRVGYFICIIMMIIGAAGRLDQYVTNIDLRTGYYFVRYPIISPLAMILLAGGAAAALFALFGRESDKVLLPCILVNPYRLRYMKLRARQPLSSGVASLVFGVVTIAQTGYTISLYVMEYTSSQTSPRIVDILACGFAVLSALIMFSVANTILTGKAISSNQAGAISVLAVWKALEAAQIVSTADAVYLNSEEMYLLLQYCASAGFFLSFTRLYLGYERRLTRITFMIYGYAAAILACVTTLPRIALYYITLPEMTSYIIFPNLSDIMMVMLPLAFLDVFWGPYEYKMMPKVTYGNTVRRKWSPAKKRAFKRQTKVI